MDGIAESYVKLVLAIGQYDANYVDSFYGPPEWKKEAEAHKRPLPELHNAAYALKTALAAVKPAATADELTRLRFDYLTTQIRAAGAKVDLLMGKKMTFDEESKALYDVVAPTYDEQHFADILAKLDKAVPAGPGDLATRLDAFRTAFVIPKDKLDAVFSAAIAECRKRSLPHLQLPANENFRVEYVTNKSWGGYNWYQGDFHSVIQVNTDFPIFIDRAVDLACHEGYPGHHVYNALLERLVRDHGFKELSVYALYSPQSLIAEGTANFGIDVAFPGASRVEFERRVLFPLAGIDPSKTERFYEVLELTRGLSYAGNESARRYLDGKISRADAVAWMIKYALMTPERAEQRMKFTETYRTYVINYNYGQDLVKQYVEKQGGTVDHPDKRWSEFVKLIASPRLPGGLQ